MRLFGFRGNLGENCSMKGLDKFGAFIVQNVRDKALEQSKMLFEGRLQAKAIADLQAEIAALPDHQKRLLARVVRDVIDTALHDLLFSLQDAHDRKLGIEVFVDGENVAELSGMLNGEHLGEGGWIERFSQYR